MATEKQLGEWSRLGKKIAAELFRDGTGQKAQRLVLTIDTPTPRNLGGWSERAVADRIYDVLRKDRAK